MDNGLNSKSCEAIAEGTKQRQQIHRQQEYRQQLHILRSIQKISFRQRGLQSEGRQGGDRT